tara:strand:- start:693 stop:1109 length:417 start_codon:yes stop_codon:yes gene_type:complete
MKIKKNGKVINLTESDLKRIVKKVLNEQSPQATTDTRRNYNELDSKGLKQKIKELSQEIKTKLRGWVGLTPEEKWKFKDHIVFEAQSIRQTVIKLGDSRLEKMVSKLWTDFISKIESIEKPSAKDRRDWKRDLKSMEN